ncbi:hypothetical protein [Glaciecola petra]|uniref:Lipoprotein n=1 Tax=Glaciecola petra TaxID=3075602 RepID=A0ABU2ZTW9_9ALTE|nr:hypothetical protein [Aestuariibacter sp. P117]MDT0596087.1 hypothetical protein [Aestuariibacter sp. P117]
MVNKKSTLKTPCSKIAIMMTACAIVGGCASANTRYEQLNAHLDNSINCDTANEQIQELEANRISSTEEFANGVASVLPTSIVFNLIAGEYTNRAKIASGKYNDELRARITLIKTTCLLGETNTSASKADDTAELIALR